MKIKENISLVDTINAIEYITESYFKEGDIPHIMLTLRR